MRRAAALSVFLALLCACSSFRIGKKDSRVDRDLAALEAEVRTKRAEFAKTPAKPEDPGWVRKKLAHMVDVDQFMRHKFDLPFQKDYTAEEKRRFMELYGARLTALDKEHTRELKKLIDLHGWFTIDAFGAPADSDAWLLVQHADTDVVFQKRILDMLHPLLESGGTDPGHFAYLYDRVATNTGRPQRYGTQGSCKGPGRWEPGPLEDPLRIDEFRTAMGLSTLAAYKKRFLTLCR